MRDTAKRIVERVYRYFHLLNVDIPVGHKAELEDIVLDVLQLAEKRGSMSGREEHEK